MSSSVNARSLSVKAQPLAWGVSIPFLLRVCTMALDETMALQSQRQPPPIRHNSRADQRFSPKNPDLPSHEWIAFSFLLGIEIERLHMDVTDRVTTSSGVERRRNNRDPDLTPNEGKRDGFSFSDQAKNALNARLILGSKPRPRS